MVAAAEILNCSEQLLHAAPTDYSAIKFSLL